MRSLLIGVMLGAAAASAAPYGKAPNAGLVYELDRVAASARGGPESGIASEVIVHHADIASPVHHANANMASIELFVCARRSTRATHTIAPESERVYVVISGQVRFDVDGQEFEVAPFEMMFVPGGSRCGWQAGDADARILAFEWSMKGMKPEKRWPAVVSSERLRPMKPTPGKGFVSVLSEPRNHGIPVAVVTVGDAHIGSDSIVHFYPADLPTLDFRANSALVRMSMSAYHPEGGTRWHLHPEREQAFIVMSGQALFEIGANAFIAKAGDLIFAPRHIGHAYRTIGNEPVKFLEFEWGR